MAKRRHVEIKNPICFKRDYLSREEFDAIPIGAKLRAVENGYYYMKIDPKGHDYMEDFVVDLITGRIIHHSKAGLLEEVSVNEIMW